MSEENFTRQSTQDNFATEKIDVIKNNLLGSYDEANNYFISPQIIDELIALKKVKKSSYNNSNFCVGHLLGYGEIVFEIEFDDATSSDGMAKANFYVLEDVEKINGYLQNVIKTKIDEFVAPLDDFIQKSYEYYHIFDDVDSDEGKDKKLLDDLSGEDSYILAKKQFMLMLDKLSDEQFLDAYGKYFSDRITLLTTTENDYCKAVLQKFNQEYDMIEKLFLSNKNFKVLNELLDKCIEEISGTNENWKEQEEEFKNSLSTSLEEFTNSVNNINEKFEDKAISMLGKSDKRKLEEIKLSENEHNKQIEEMENQPIEAEISDNPEMEVDSEEPTLDDMKNVDNEMSSEVAEAQENTSSESESKQKEMERIQALFGIDLSQPSTTQVQEDEGATLEVETPEIDEVLEETPSQEEESGSFMDMFRRKENLSNDNETIFEEEQPTNDGKTKTLSDIFQNLANKVRENNNKLQRYNESETVESEELIEEVSNENIMDEEKEIPSVYETPIISTTTYDLEDSTVDEDEYSDGLGPSLNIMGQTQDDVQDRPVEQPKVDTNEYGEMFQANVQNMLEGKTHEMSMDGR
ncbi:MAG: hypothetical protein E7345_01990 [Clostridiales bacterium]|nr:hypothetical protein [Clostridiales bacterium]